MGKKVYQKSAGELSNGVNLYLNYARENWTLDNENPPVGLILCAYRDTAVAKYALEGLPNKVMAAEYRTTLPDEKLIAAELERARRLLDERRQLALSSRTRAKRGKGMPGLEGK